MATKKGYNFLKPPNIDENNKIISDAVFAKIKKDGKILPIDATIDITEQVKKDLIKEQKNITDLKFLKK